MTTLDAPPGDAGPDTAVLELRDVWKSFGGVAALSGAHLKLRPREIHALIGENGAGKSTLINIATGVHQPDQGGLFLNDRPVQFSRPKAAVDHGVSVVHQERNLVGKFSIAENLFLGHPPTAKGVVSHRRMVVEATPWLRRVGLDVDPLTPAARLSPGQAQLLEIAKALAQRCQVLLMDEPTSSIAEGEMLHLFEILRSLRDEGASIVFVSHKLDEVYALCDRVTVLRDGRNIVTGALFSELTRAEVVHAMVGRNVEALATTAHKRPLGEPRLKLVGVSTEFGHNEINLTVHAGEVVGLYGLVGAGRTELMRCLVGLAKITSGQMFVGSKAVRVRNPYDALRNHGIGYVSEDRKGEGTILAHAISRNVGITIWDRVAHGPGWISDRATKTSIEPPVTRLKVKMQGLMQPVASLSGGNQQKVSIAKWLAADARVLIFDEPTCGIDVATKDEVHRLVMELAAQGMAVLLVSSELREVIQLADRVLVMAGLRLLTEMDNNGDYDVMSKQIMRQITEASVVGPPG